MQSIWQSACRFGWDCRPLVHVVRSQVTKVSNPDGSVSETVEEITRGPNGQMSQNSNTQTIPAGVIQATTPYVAQRLLCWPCDTRFGAHATTLLCLPGYEINWSTDLPVLQSIAVPQHDEMNSAESLSSSHQGR